jgi:hypothetical protein
MVAAKQHEPRESLLLWVDHSIPHSEIVGNRDNFAAWYDGIADLGLGVLSADEREGVHNFADLHLFDGAKSSTRKR